MEFKGRIKNLYNTFDKENNYIVEIETSYKNINDLDKLKEKGDLTFKVEKHKEKRTLRANNYMWYLLEECAKALKTTKKELYKKYVKEYGIYKVMEMTPDAFKTMSYTWEKMGIAWFSEVVDFAEDPKYIIANFYYGTSMYNKKQMQVLLEAIVEDARAGNIPTKEDFEIKMMLNEMENRKE